MEPVDVADCSNPKFLKLDDDQLIYLDERNPKVLEDYLELRRKIFASDPVTEKILKPNQGWEYDLDTHVLIAKNLKGECVGGAIIIANYCEDGLLPLESDDFKLREIFPNLHLDKNYYAEFTHFIIDPKYRDWHCSGNIFRCIHNLCVARNIQYLFGTAPLDRARRNTLGLKILNIGLTAKIEKQLEIPHQDAWNGYQRFLLTVDITPRFALFEEEQKDKSAASGDKVPELEIVV